MIDFLDLASATMKDMGLNEADCCKVVKELDELPVDQIYPFLENKLAPVMLIAGHYQSAAARGIDVYDECLKFIQDKFYRARVKKDCAGGWYVLIAAELVKP